MEEEILIYTIKQCPYCERAKALFQKKGMAFKEIDASNPETRIWLVENTKGRKTVPQIFIKGESIGGYDDLKALDEQGKLKFI